MERLARQVQVAQRVLESPDADWSEYVSVIDDVATAVEQLGDNESKKDAVKLLLSISMQLGEQITSIRSKVVKEVCEHLVRIVKATGRDFQELANALLEDVVQTTKSSLSAIRLPGTKLLSKMSEFVRYDLSLLQKIFVDNTQEKVRMVLLEQLMIIFVYWSDNEVQLWDDNVQEIIRRALKDQSEKVRKVARETLTTFTTRWSERVEELAVTPSSQSKMLLIREHPDSPLAAALQARYPDLANKADSSSRRHAFAKQRSSYLKSPRRSVSQSIEIHLPNSPAKPRAQPDSISRRRSENKRGKEDASLRLTENDQENSPDTFGGSQMYGFPPKVPKNMDSHKLDSNKKTPGQPLGSPRRKSLSRSRSASNAEEAAMRNRDIMRLQETKIPSPLTRSPVLQRKHFDEMDTASVGSNSPRSAAKHQSQLARPSSSTLKFRGGASSTSVNTDGEFNPGSSRSSDDYFSKPIPSTKNATPSPPPPTDNVTFRRRTYVQADLGSSQLSPAVRDALEFTRPTRLDTEMDSDYLNDSFEDESSSPQERQYHSNSQDPERSASSDGNGSRQLDESDNCETSNSNLYDDDKERSGENVSTQWNPIDETKGEQDETTRQLDESENGDSNIFTDENTTSNRETNTPTGWGLTDENAQMEEEREHVEARQLDESDEGSLGDLKFYHNHRLDRDGGEWSPDHRHIQKEASHAEDDDKLGTSRSDGSDANVGSEPKLSDDSAVQNEDGNPPDEWHLDVECDDSDHAVLDEHDESTYQASNEEETPDVEYSPSRLRAFEESESIDEASTELKSKDALEGLQDVFDTFARLRAENVGPQRVDGPSYLERLTLADRTERTPPESSTPPHDEKDNEDGLTSPQKMFKGVTTDDEADTYQHESFDFMKAPSDSPHVQGETAYLASNEGSERLPDAFPREETARFEAAEKLIAAQFPDPPPTHHYYDTPRSPEPELYLRTEPLHERTPPTQMGAKLSPVVAIPDAHDVASKQEATAPKQEEVARVEPRPDLLKPTEPKPPSQSVAKRMPARSVARLGWVSSASIALIVLLAVLFCITGILQAVRKVRDSQEYHTALQASMDEYAAIIEETHEKVLRLEEDYATWNEYVTKLAEEDAANAAMQLEALQTEVEKWQQEMEVSLVEFRQELSLKSIENAFEAFRLNATNKESKN